MSSSPGDDQANFEEADSLYTRAMALGETLSMNKPKLIPMVLCNQAGLFQKQVKIRTFGSCRYFHFCPQGTAKRKRRHPDIVH